MLHNSSVTTINDNLVTGNTFKQISTNNEISICFPISAITGCNVSFNSITLTIQKMAIFNQNIIKRRRRTIGYHIIKTNTCTATTNMMCRSSINIFNYTSFDVDVIHYSSRNIISNNINAYTLR